MPLWSHLFEKVITRINGAVFDMQMGKVFSVMRHDTKPALLTLNYQLRIDCLYVDNDCMTMSNGQYLIEYVLGHVLFDIWIYVHLAFKSLNGLLIVPHLIQKVIVCTFWILVLNGDTNISHFFEWVVDWSPSIQKLLFVLSAYWYWMKIHEISYYAWIPIGINCWCLNIKNCELI